MPLKMIREDITRIRCDAIVNSTNERLHPDGGTDAAIHEAAGKALYEDCRKIGQLRHKDAVVTPAYNLPSRFVIHVTGPVYNNGKSKEAEMLCETYRAALNKAKDLSCESVAFPLISSGLYGFPKELVLKLAINEISEFLLKNEMTVYLAVFDKESYAISRQLFFDVAAYIDEAYVFSHTDAARFAEDESYARRRAVRAKRGLYTDKEARESLAPDKSLERMLKDLDDGFAVALLKLIDEKGINEVLCYKKANVSKQTWYKILNEKDYKPKKSTVLSFALSLSLSLEETQALLGTVGYTLSRSCKFDVIVSYFISHGKYDIYEIDQTLFQFDQPTLSSYS